MSSGISHCLSRTRFAPHLPSPVHVPCRLASLPRTKTVYIIPFPHSLLPLSTASLLFSRPILSPYQYPYRLRRQPAPRCVCVEAPTHTLTLNLFQQKPS